MSAPIHEVNIATRQQRITALTCFAMLTADESKKLAALMTEKKYSAGQKIVSEDDLVDSVFIIVEGQAEVSHQVVAKKRKLTKRKPVMTTIPVARLNPGEAIGLNDTGFFSATGIRTATVTALTPVRTLHLDLKHLHEFLQQHPHLKTEMHAASAQMQKMRLIKQTLPFTQLSHERLIRLSQQIESVNVAAGEIVFHEGDAGDRCYLIHSGEVEIIGKDDDGSSHVLTVLSSPSMFGEATLITRSPRNATARAKTACELFELKHDDLSELLESESNVAKMFMTLMIDRSRPLKNPHVLAHKRVTVDHQTVVILKNPENGNYFKLSEEGWFVWQQMDGNHAMQEITLDLAEKFNVFAPEVVAGLISRLAKTGFVTHVETESEAAAIKKTRLAKCMSTLRYWLEFRFAFGDADKWLTKVYKKGAYLLFTPFGKLFLGLLIVMGLFAFGFSTHHVLQLFRTIHDSWILLVFIVPAMLVSVALHELGHALATKSCGQEVHYMGVGWFWFGPVAFTDTSDMWLSTRGPRIFVNLAGVYTDILVAGVCSILIFFLPGAHLQAFLWLFALFTYLSAFRMLNPLQELDGYYVLMDVFDRPRLRQSAVKWLVKDFPYMLRAKDVFSKHVAEVCYWLACILFLVSVSLLTLMVQTFIFKILGFQPSNMLISLSLPLIAALVSSLGIIADVVKAED